MIKSMALAGLLGASTLSLGTTVAVIDSGLDYQHSELKDYIWYNPAETSGNSLDDDENGLVDDVRGWNFANNHSRLIDYDDDLNFRPDIIKFLDIQTRSLQGDSTEGERIWAQNMMKDGNFTKAINGFLNYAHGTHVAGIMTKGLSNAEVIDIRVIAGKPMEEAKEELTKKINKAIQANENYDFILEFVFKLGLKFYAKQQAKIFSNIADYLVSKDVKVANASIGFGLNQARQFVMPFLTIIKLGQAPSQEEVDEYALHYLRESRMAQQEAFAKAEDILFIFASGNDGEDNDYAPTLPAGVGLPNTMSVGATIGVQMLAPFSNYGASTVDVFAPGVGIQSLAPMDRTLSMSGTSQAAPLVARIATQIRQANPGLSPFDVKNIIMGTTDRKSFLKGRAYTEGVANGDRAIKAAELTANLSVSEAIAQSRLDVADTQDLIDIVGEPIMIGKPFMPRR